MYYMLLESLTLRNIRSHTDTHVEFPKGLVLLSGDIGAGKSSLLLAIEFALFGIRRGDVAGEGLLRHGEQSGAVTLAFRLKDCRVAVHRELKRSSGSVRQDTGWLEVDGEREELTAREIKARVLALLGYPEELVTKSKGFVFRYTVYTPQEEMKQIIYESDSNRLDVLRSVFDIDKYKTIGENASLVGKQLRDKARFLAGSVEDLADLAHEHEELGEQLAQLKEDLEDLEEAEQQAKQAYKQQKQQAQELEEAYEQEQKRRQELKSAQAKRSSSKKQLAQLQEDREELEEVVAQERERPSNPDERLAKLRSLREKNQRHATAAQTKTQSLQEEIKRLRKEAERIDELDVCPKCQQPVTDDHKHGIEQEAEDAIEKREEQRRRYEEQRAKAQKNLEKLAEKEAALEKQRERFEQYKAFAQKQQGAKQQLEKLSEREENLREELQSLSERLEELAESSFDAEAYQQQKKSLERAREAYSQAKLARSKAQTKIESLSEQQQKLSRRVEKKRSAKKRLQAVREKEQWLKKVLQAAVADIEKRVFSSIHQEFSAKFTQWFLQLLEDDSLFASLDESFAPVLTQDGYDVGVSSLSGGEKQSVALAYRLALNNVVNSVVRTLNTGDLLILDEPTDGFSDLQLDRVRDVLESVRCEQILLVSHEQKMQSFVDHVVAVRKRDQVTVVE